MTLFSLVFLLLELPTLADGVLYLVAAAIAFTTFKSGLLQQLFSSSNSLLTLRTTERDDAIREKEKYKTKCEELEVENRILRREITQRIEINILDQQELRELRGKD